jgi:HK97 family phage major capsid protein
LDETEKKLKELNDQITGLVTQLQQKDREMEQKLISKASFEEYKTSLEVKYAALAAEVVKLQAPGPGIPAEPDKKAAFHKKAFENYVRKGADTLTPDERKVMTISDLTTGGYLAAPYEMVKEILANVTEYSPIRALARVIPIGVGGLDWPKKTGTFAAYRTSEIGTRSETTGLTFGLEKIPADEMYALVKVSKQNIEDSAFPLESFIVAEAAEQFGVKEGTEGISGSGASGQMEGILTNSAITGFTGVTTSGKILADDLKQLFYSLKDFYAKNGTWIWRRASTLAISLLKNTTTTEYLWQPGLKDGSAATVMGRPYVECPDMPAEANSAKAVAFGDFKKGYVIADRLGMETQRLIEQYATSGQVGLLFRRRVGGQVVLPEAIKILTLKA